MTTLTVGDAAYRLEVRPLAIYELVDQDKVRLVKVDGRWVVREDDLPAIAAELGAS